MTAHVHAELMKQYAEDALETDKPWERWEMQGHITKHWYRMSSCPDWDKNVKYRRKPSTININGYEVPEPMREAPGGSPMLYSPSLDSGGSLYVGTRWDGFEYERRVLARGMFHRTKEAAELHAKALLSFTHQDTDQ